MIVTVIYPRSEGATFDMSYYLEKHMKLVQARWGGHGMSSARVLRGTGSLGGEADYEVITLLEFASQAAFLQAAGAHADEIMADVPRFTNIKPLIQLNEVALG